jgi:hypothetical protein
MPVFATRLSCDVLAKLDPTSTYSGLPGCAMLVQAQALTRTQWFTYPILIIFPLYVQGVAGLTKK